VREKGLLADQRYIRSSCRQGGKGSEEGGLIKNRESEDSIRGV